MIRRSLAVVVWVPVHSSFRTNTCVRPATRGHGAFAANSDTSVQAPARAGAGPNQICGVVASDFTSVPQRAREPVPATSETRLVPTAASRTAATWAVVRGAVAERAPDRVAVNVPTAATRVPREPQAPRRITTGYFAEAAGDEEGEDGERDDRQATGPPSAHPVPPGTPRAAGLPTGSRRVGGHVGQTFGATGVIRALRAGASVTAPPSAGQSHRSPRTDAAPTQRPTPGSSDIGGSRGR